MRTTDGLGVEAPVDGVVELPVAVLAEGEVEHRRPLPVVGDVGHGREARAADGAAGERVEVVPVRRVEELPEAVAADRDVRWDE